MFVKQRWMRMALLALIAMSLVGLPMAAGAADEVNGTTSPSEGATVMGTATVEGYASDPNFQKWQLDVLPGGAADAAIFLALGEEPGKFSVNVDTTNFPDGEHALRLRVVRNDSNYDEVITKFKVANAAYSPPAQGPAASDIVSTAVAAGTFKTLAAALQATGLDKTLQGAGPFTVFAPNDAAFAKLPAGTVEGLLKDPKALSNILLYHVVAGKVMSSDLTNGMKANTVQGSPVTFTVADGKVKVNDANVIAADIAASNGVIHVIDAVILPPAAAPAAPAPAAPANRITSPAEGATVNGTATVTGNANDPNFAKWQLDVLPGGAADAAIFLAFGEEAGKFSYDVDTTQFPNGEHALRLRVVRSDGNYDEYITKFTIAN